MSRIAADPRLEDNVGARNTPLDMPNHSEDEFGPPPPHEGFFARLKRWLYDDARISTGIALVCFSTLGAVFSLDLALGVFFFGEDGLLQEFVLQGTMTLGAFLGGLGLLLRQGWARGVAMGVVLSYLILTLGTIGFVPSEGFTLFRVSVLLLGLAAVIQLPNMTITHEDERAAQEQEELRTAVLAYAQAVLDRADEVLGRASKTHQEGDTENGLQAEDEHAVG